MPRWPGKTPAAGGSSGVRQDSPDAPPLGPPFESGLVPFAALDATVILKILQPPTVSQRSAVTPLPQPPTIEQPFVPGPHFRVPLYSAHGNVRSVAEFY